MFHDNSVSLLGLGPDHSLLCILPEDIDVPELSPDIICKGRSLLDGDTYQFETTIREILPSPSAIRLNAPTKITREIPRTYPRVPVELTGTVRPISDSGRVLAVLPVSLHDLCPTGCQLRVPASTWPDLSIRQVFLSCQLPTQIIVLNFMGKLNGSVRSPNFTSG